MGYLCMDWIVMYMYALCTLIQHTMKQEGEMAVYMDC